MKFTNVLKLFGIFVFGEICAFGEDLGPIDFKELENKATVLPKWKNVFVQYGVKPDGAVCYLVISSGLKTTALVVENLLKQDGSRNVVARIEVIDEKMPPPSEDLNFLFCDKKGVIRKKLPPINEKDLKEILGKVEEINLSSMMRELSSRGLSEK